MISRKLLIRVVGAPILLAGLAAIVYADHRAQRVVAVRFLVAAACALGMVEFLSMVRKKGHPVAGLSGVLLLSLPLLPWAWMIGKPVPALFPIAAVLFLLIVLFKMVFRYGTFTVEGAALSIAGFGYLSLMHLACEVPAPVTPVLFSYFLVFLVATNKGSDMAAFVAGKSFGRHKMTPVLSPNKTWEGAVAGGIVGSGAGFAVLRWTPIHAAYPAVPDWCLLSLAVSVTIASQVGDLAESAFKRWAGVKDSGGLLPEFGGILDMMDSFILSVPVAYLGSELLSRVAK